MLVAERSFRDCYLSSDPPDATEGLLFVFGCMVHLIRHQSQM